MRGLRDVLAHHVIFAFNRAGLAAPVQTVLAHAAQRTPARPADHPGSPVMAVVPEDPRTIGRMHAAVRRACLLLDVTPVGDRCEWGWRGRTLSRPVHTGDGPAWLRIAGARHDHVDRTFWDGTLAATRLPAGVPRPRLRAHRDWMDDLFRYRAELHDHASAPTVSPSAILEVPPSLPAGWYDELRAALGLLSTVDTDRHTISQQYLHTVMPRYLDGPIDSTVPAWSTAHGDLHFANLCAPAFTMLDWEGWGQAPTGYDAATLHTYSLLVPDTAHQVHTAFADILDTPTGLFAQQAVVCELLHSTTRGANLALTDLLRHRARQLSTAIRT